MPLIALDLPQTEAAVIEMTNAFRAENHLAAVKPNPTLQIAAKAFADYLARSGSFAHTADGRQPAERALSAGYHYCIVAENLALHQSNRGFETTDLAQRAVEGWKNSPPHRANLLQPFVTETGIGIAKASDGDPKYLTVQLFGRPESSKYSIDIQNLSGATVSYTLGDQKNTINASMRVTHTACVPYDLSFDTGKVTSRFQTHNGETFLISRGADGKPRVDVEQPATVTAHATSAAVTTKPVKPAR